MTPRCPKYRGVAIVDLLKIQKSPKCRRVETPRCPKYRRVETPRCPKYRGVRTTWYLGSQNSRCPMKSNIISVLIYGAHIPYTKSDNRTKACITVLVLEHGYHLYLVQY